jgi:hypothetical protein
MIEAIQPLDELKLQKCFAPIYQLTGGRQIRKQSTSLRDTRSLVQKLICTPSVLKNSANKHAANITKPLNSMSNYLQAPMKQQNSNPTRHNQVPFQINNLLSTVHL